VAIPQTSLRTNIVEKDTGQIVDVNAIHAALNALTAALTGTNTADAVAVRDAIGALAANKAGAANGVATLGADTKLTAAQLPSITKTTVGLSNVDNTSDASKPISTLQQAALDAKQNSLGVGTSIAGVPDAGKVLWGDGAWRAPAKRVEVWWVTGTGWGSYSTDPAIARDFSSENDAAATAPTFYSPRDRWYPKV
jgi:hypothetical protein